MDTAGAAPPAAGATRQVVVRQAPLPPPVSFAHGSRCSVDSMVGRWMIESRHQPVSRVQPPRLRLPGGLQMASNHAVPSPRSGALMPSKPTLVGGQGFPTTEQRYSSVVVLRVT